MNNIDQLFRFIFENLDIRGEFIKLSKSWKDAQGLNDYPDNVQKQLGEALAAIAILSSTIKFDGNLILQVQGDGPLSTLVTQASHDGKIRGLAKWKQLVPQGSLEDVYGKGQIAITVRNKNGEPYQSIVPLIGKDLSEALEYYFEHSEQLKSCFYLFVNRDQVAGLFLQALPNQSGSESQRKEDWDRLTMLAETATAEEFFNLEPEEILHRLYHEEQVRVFEPKNFHFECSCSQQKIESSLLAMGQETLFEILDEDKKIDVDCEFCNQHYQFKRSDIDALLTTNNDASNTDEKPSVIH